MQTATIMITAAPFLGVQHTLALRFAHQWLASGHCIKRVFFYGDATLVANCNIQPPQGQAALIEQWSQWSHTSGVPLQVCIANAIRRGLLDQDEAQRYNKAQTLHPSFELVGLGELAAIGIDGDKLVQF